MNATVPPEHAALVAAAAAQASRALQAGQASTGAVRPCIGVDLVDVDAIARSVADFGACFLDRFFTKAEQAACRQADGRLDAARLATRFAAKEAAIKALGLSEAGVRWTALEVAGGGSHEPRLVLHGPALAAARARALAPDALALSLSHEGRLACAMVVGLPGDASSRPDSLPDPVPPLP